MARLWVAQLDISYAVEQKLIHKHRVQPHDVRDAVQCVTGLIAARDYHRERGLRFIIEGLEIKGSTYLVVLYPVKYRADEFRLGTCHPY